MNLRWKSFERGLKRRVRTEVRASPTLRQEYKHAQRGRRWWNFRVTPNFYRLVFWFVALNFLGRGLMPVGTVLAFIWLWALAATFWWAGRLQSTLYFAAELNLFHHLPITDAEIFQVQWRKFYRAALWPILDFAFLYGALAYQLGAGWQSPATGVLFGCLQGFFNIAIATGLLGFGMRRWLPVSALLLYVTAVGLLFFGSRLPGFVGLMSAAAYWIPPAGWVHFALGLKVSSGAGHDWVPCLIAGTALAVFPIARRRLERNYQLTEGVFAQAFQFTATGEAAALRLKDYGEQFAQPPQDVSASIAARAFLDQLDWRKAGLVERIVARTLTEREQTIAEFLTAANPGWTKSWRMMVLVGLALLIAMKVFSMQSVSGLAVITFIVVLLMGGNQAWRGFGPAAPVGLPPPLYALYPVGFFELHRTVLKIMLVRFLLFLPLLAGAAGLFITTLPANSSPILLKGGKLFLLGLAALPILAIMPFSAASNDSDRWRFTIPALLYALLLVGCGVAFVFVESLPVTGVTGLTGGLLSWAAPRLYGWRFNRNQFDLLPATRNTNAAPLPRG